MAELINLRSKRKAVARTAARAESDENAVKFGRTKGQKTREAAEIAKARAALDGKKFEEGGPA